MYFSALQRIACECSAIAGHSTVCNPISIGEKSMAGSPNTLEDLADHSTSMRLWPARSLEQGKLITLSQTL